MLPPMFLKKPLTPPWRSTSTASSSALGSLLLTSMSVAEQHGPLMLMSTWGSEVSMRDGDLVRMSGDFDLDFCALGDFVLVLIFGVALLRLVSSSTFGSFPDRSISVGSPASFFAFFDVLSALGDLSRSTTCSTSILPPSAASEIYLI